MSQLKKMKMHHRTCWSVHVHGGTPQFALAWQYYPPWPHPHTAYLRHYRYRVWDVKAQQSLPVILICAELVYGRVSGRRRYHRIVS
jgi:hypothetical protein